MDTIEARYEWRIWDDDLGEVDARIRSLSECHGTRHSTETYLVSRADTGVNPKIRDDKLDIKVLVAVEEGYEQWQPRLKATFPVSDELLRTDLFPLLGLEPPRLDRVTYELADFLHDVVDPDPDVAAVEVVKVRHAFTVTGCIAEVADVTIAGRALQTASVESGDLDALGEARRATGLDRYENVSYPRIIRDTVGLHDRD